MQSCRIWRFEKLHTHPFVRPECFHFSSEDLQALTCPRSTQKKQVALHFPFCFIQMNKLLLPSSRNFKIYILLHKASSVLFVIMLHLLITLNLHLILFPLRSTWRKRNSKLSLEQSAVTFHRCSASPVWKHREEPPSYNSSTQLWHSPGWGISSCHNSMS